MLFFSAIQNLVYTSAVCRKSRKAGSFSSYVPVVMIIKTFSVVFFDKTFFHMIPVPTLFINVSYKVTVNNNFKKRRKTGQPYNCIQ